MFDDKTKEAFNNVVSKFLKGSDFEAGIVLKFKTVEKVANANYGAPDDAAAVERGILEEGETFRYTFEDSLGNERLFESHSMPFAMGMHKADIQEEDLVKIIREGKGTKTRYLIEKQ